MKTKVSIFSILFAMLFTPAFAGWQYEGYYTTDGYYRDDGSRFIIGLRGGVAAVNAKMKNEIGSLYSAYMVNDATGSVVSYLSWENDGSPSGYSVAGQGNLGDLPLNGDFNKTVFTAGGSVGFVFPNHTQWRLQADYDYISETDYNRTPLLDGNLSLVDGVASVVRVASTSASYTVSTDIVSAVLYYDFFDGLKKPQNKLIPYVGFGLGYAVSHTTLALYDISGDLSYDDSLRDFGTVNSTTYIVKFDNPTEADKYPASNNVAVVAALGASYGIADRTYVDFGARFMYLPKITWNIANDEGTKHREWFSAEKVLYTNLMIGLRFEF